MTSSGTRLNDAQRSMLSRQHALREVPLRIANFAVIDGRDLDVCEFFGALSAEVRSQFFSETAALVSSSSGTSSRNDQCGQYAVDFMDVRGRDDPMSHALQVMYLDLSTAVNPIEVEVGRGILFQIDLGRFVLYQRTHHVVTDGVAAMGAMVRVLRNCAAVVSGEAASQLAAVDLSVAARAELAYRRSSRFALDRDYWVQNLSGLDGPAVSLALRLGQSEIVNRTASIALDLRVMALLRCIEGSKGVTIPGVICAAIAAFFSRVTDANDVTFSLAVAARTTAELRASPLPMVNFVPLRTGVSSSVSVSQALHSSQGSLMGALRHQRYRDEDIVANMGFRVGGPVLNIMMFDRKLEFGAFTAEFHPITTGPVEDLSINLYPEGLAKESLASGRLILDLEANPNRYDEAEVAEHHRQIVAMIGEVARALVESPDVLIDDLPLLVDEPEALSTASVPVVLPDVLDATVERFGGRVAADAGAFGEVGALTFGELDSLARGLAKELRESGALPGGSVAVMLGRGVEQIITWWAVARTGATVVLVDPDQPASRTEYVLGVVRPVVVVVGDGFAAGRVDLSGCGGVVSVGGWAAGVSTRSSDSASDRLARRGEVVGREDWELPHVDDAAYIVFTSGTTGTPKGIAVSHRGLANLLRDAEKLFDDGRGEPGRLAGVASPAFDIAHFEMLVCAGLGYTLVPMPEVGAGLGDRLVEHNVSHLYATPSLIARIPTEQLPPTVCTIGEALPPPVAKQVAEVSTLRNTYGPAEATLYATVAEIGADVLQDRPTSIGLPVQGMAAYVLDHKLRPLPPGILGELYLAGAQLALGYVERTDLTASRFVACPWNPGQRMYRTGDVVRIDPTSRQLEFHGRNDDQISVHGVRIEPAEIERLAAEVDGVDAAVAVPAQTEHGTSIEVALTAQPGANPAALATAVRHHLFGTLPSVMWPRRVLVIDSLPLGTTGKLDRRAIAEHFAATPIEPVAYQAPNTDTEHTVAQTVSQILSIDDPSMLASVIDLGGTSLALMEIVGRLGTATGRTLRIADITVATTLADVAATIDAAPTITASADTAPAVSPTPVLTPAQQQLWLLNRRDPRIAAYHLPAHLTLDDGIDTGTVTAALTDVTARHDALRIVFPAAADGTATARVISVDSTDLPITVGPLSDTDIHAVATAPFDLTVEPPWRAAIDDSASQLSLVLVAHHIAIDATSMPIVIADFLTALAARREGRAPMWPAPAAMGLEVSDSIDMAESDAYWREYLAGASDRLALPEPATETTGGVVGASVSHRHRRLDAAHRAALAETATACGVTPHTLLRVALAAALAAHTGTDDTVVSIPTSGRSGTDDLARVGMFVRTVPLRLNGIRDLLLSEAAHQADDALAQAIPHADAAPPGLADVLLTLDVPVPTSLPGVVHSAAMLSTGSARAALEFIVTDTAEHAGSGNLDIRMTVAHHHVDATGAERILDTLLATLTRIAAATPDTFVDACLPPIPSPASTPRHTRAIDPIRALIPHTTETPHAAAVVHDDTTLSYAQLAAQARRLALDLQKHGVRDGDRVALLMGRSTDTIVAMVAVLMAGAAYVPIDPEYPPSRIDTLIDATAPTVILRDGLHIGTVDATHAAHQRIPGAAYLIHTSGSTGDPKGVVVSRDNLAAMLGATLTEIGAGPADVWSWAHSYAFDFSVWEVFGALASGGTIVVLDRDTVRDPWQLATALDTHAVTVLSQTPTAFARLADPTIAATLPSALPALRCVVFGGEPLRPPTLRDWAATHPAVRLINMYGITETTVHLTAGDVDVDDARSMVGAPLDGVQYSVRDARLRRTPVGGRGELYVSGAQVSLGYLGAPAGTALRFVADPDHPGRRMYRTGDVVRLHSDDRLQYLGRADDQIQLRGHRIEPGEIAAVLRRAPGIRDARVLVAPGARDGDEQLVAFVIGAEAVPGVDADTSPDNDAVLATCVAQLPAHAVPSVVRSVTRWPTTDTGKLDRSALLATLDATTTPAEPLSTTEHRVAAVVGEVIGRDALTGADANFFAVGGTSLSAARLAAALSTSQRLVSVADVFAHPTVSALARLIEGPGADTVELAADDLTDAQRALWLLNRAEPDSPAYHLAVRLTVPADAATVRAGLLDVAARHAALRTVYPDVNGTPVVSVLPTAEVTDAILVDDGRDVVSTPFDLTAEVAWRAAVSTGHSSALDGLDVPDAQTTLTLVAHHIAIDGWSLPILLADLTVALDARRAGRAPHWPDTPTRPRRRVTTADPTFWDRYLDGIPEHLALPGPPDPQPAGLAGGPAHRVTRTVIAPLTDALSRRVADAGTTLYPALWLAVGATLAEITDSDDVVAGIPVAGRDDPTTHGYVGMLAHTITLRATGIGDLLLDDDNLDDNNLDAALTRAHDGITDAIAHADTAPATLPEVILDYQPDLSAILGAPGMHVEEIDTGYVRAATEVTVRHADGGLTVSVAVARHRVDPAAADIIADRTLAWLHRIAATDTTATVDEHPASPHRDATDVLTRIRAAAQLAPSAVAVSDDGADLTYTDLLTRADELATRLRDNGVHAGDRVALYLDRDPRAVIAIVGALIADATFVPLDPTQPTARHRTILDDTTPTAIVTTDLQIHPGPADAAASRDPDLAYLIHTSGSTGKPKGVMVTRAGLAAMYTATADLVGTDAHSVWAWTHAPTFDASVWEILGALVTGGRLAVIARDDVLDPPAFAEALARQGVTMLTQTPTSFLRLTTDSIATAHPDAFAALRCLMICGEPVDPTLLNEWATRHPDVRILNAYGPTETTVQVAGTVSDLTDHRPIFGTALPGVGLEVLDRRLRPVPPGGRGELYVSGIQVARGYLRDAALTGARFIAGPNGIRRYRTGDLVRLLPDGRLCYLGRSDDQIQLRGFRVEPGEITAVLQSVPGVRDARVLAIDGATPADRLLVGAVLTDTGGPENAGTDAELTEAALRDACAAQLPAHLVPARITVLTHWPLTAHGKLDHRALRAQLATPDTSGRPRTPDEDAVAAAMAAVVGVEDTQGWGPGTNFFAVGGHSLSAARLAATLSTGGRRVAVSQIFAHPTIEGLTAAIDAADGTVAGGGVALPELGSHLGDVGPRSARLPLSPEQEDLWLRWRAQPDLTGYLLTGAAPVTDVWDGTLDELRAAIRRLALRHDALRTSFPDSDTGPYQRLWTDDEVLTHLGDLPVETIDGSVADSSGTDAMTAWLRTPLHLAESLPWRVRLVEHDGTPWILVTAHHIIADGESLPIMLRQLTAPADTAPVIGYREYTRWRLATLDARRTELREHWAAVFTEPVTGLHLPELDFAAVGSGASRDHRTALTVANTDRLDALATAHRTTPFMVAHAALAAVLARHAGTDLITIGTAVSGRIDPCLDEVPGLFARAVPLHTKIDLTRPFTDLLADVTAADLAAFAHADLPLAEIGALADPQRDRVGRPLFDVVLGMGTSPAPTADGVAARTSGNGAGSLFGLDIMTHRTGGQLHLTLTCGTRVADADRLTAFGELLVDTLGRVLDQPDAPTVDLIVGRSDPDGLPDTDHPDARPAAVPQTLDALLRHTDDPDAVAVSDGATTLTRGHLDRASGALAWRLRDLGVGPGDVVAQQVPRSVEGVIATVAVARTGAAFVNIAPADPPSRRADLISRAHARVVVTRDGDTSRAVGIPTVAVDTSDPDGGDRPAFTPEDRARPLHLDDLAYLTFTSGTTGAPKGVHLTHRGLSAWAGDVVSRLRVSAADRVLHTYAPGFDAHLMGLVPVLMAGAAIQICPVDVVGGAELADVVTTTGVTVLLTTPSVLATLDATAIPQVRHIGVGGEALAPRLVADWSAGRTLSNEYGPTETTVAVSSAEYRSASGPVVTIGAPMPGVGAAILDDTLHAVPDYTIGELYLSGDGLARGYLDDPAATASAFVAGGDGRRRYRTGDLVHRRADGSLVIHGRRDDQLKVRGIRIEPAEIESALAAVPGVAAAVSGVLTTPTGEHTLVAWVTAQPGVTLDGRSVREHSRTRLPRSLVPGTVTVLDRLPLGPNGKVDRRALTVPEPAPSGAAPGTEMEHAVADIVAEVLGIDASTLTADSDFFALGGTSLSATQVSSRLAERTGRDIGVAAVFDTRTVAALAHRITESPGATTRPRPIAGPRPAVLPLAYPQRRIWIHHRIDPTSTAYHVPVVVRLTGNIDLDRLSASLADVLARHDTLHTLHPDTPDGPVQRLGDPDDVWIVHTDDPTAAIRAEITRPFDLDTGLPVHATVLTTDDDQSTGAVYLVLTLHHIAVDGWSVRLLLDDLVQTYHGVTVARPPFTYADFTQWQADVLGDPADADSLFARQLTHWRGVLDGVGAPVRLPGVSAVDVGPGGRVSTQLDSHTSDAIIIAAQRLSATTFQATHAALAAVISRWSDRDDLVIGVPVHGRSAPEWESVVGMFVNTVALRTHHRPDTTIRQAIVASRDAALDADAHADIPYEVVARAVRPDARGAGDPLTSILLVGQDVMPAVTEPLTLEVDGTMLTAEPVDLDGDEIAAKLDAELVLSTVEGQLHLTVVYSRRMPREVAEALLDGVVAAVSAVGGDIDVPFPVGVGVGVADVTSAAPSVVGVVAAQADPMTVSRVVAGIAATLKIDPADVGEDADFFDLGGTSLSATQLAGTLGERIGVRVPTRMIFDHPAVADLAAAITALTVESEVGDASVTAVADSVDDAAAADSVDDEDDGVDEGGDLPLAPTQRRMWVAAHTVGNTPMYVVPIVIAVPDGTTMSRVSASVDALIARHDALRTIYPATADGPRQHVLPDWRPDLHWLDADALTPALIGSLMRTPFDVTTVPPVRAYALLGDTAAGPGSPLAVALVIHHIAIDGDSATFLDADLSALLSGHGTGIAAPQFSDVTRELLAAERAARADELAFWADTLRGYDDDLDLVASRPTVRDHTTAIVHRDLDDGLATALAAAGRHHHVTGFHLMHAALAWALGVHTGTDDVAIATTTSLRRRAEWRDAVGMLVSTVVLRSRIRGGVAVDDYLTEVRDADLAALDHALVAFDDVVAHVGARREPGRNPLAQVALTVDAGVDSGVDGAAADEGATPQSEFDIRVSVTENADTHTVRFLYAADLFDAATVQRLADRMTAALRVLAGDPTHRLDGADLLSATETALIGAAADAPAPAEPPSLGALFDAPAQRTGGWLALDDGRRALTYTQLADWVSVTAHALVDKGIRPGDAVTVEIPRSIESMVAVRAIARLGAVYVPVDVTNPPERIAAIRAATGATALRVADIPPRPDATAAPEQGIIPFPPAAVRPDDLAYIITTSGTTGQPNAVAVSHSGLHRLSSVARIDAFDRVAAMVSPGFDPSIMEMVLPLDSGATLVVVPPEIIGGSDLTTWLAKAGVTVFIATPSVLATLDPEPLHLLRMVFVGGEALPADLADRWASHCALINTYGPTEATVAATAGQHRSGRPVTIGTPVDGVGVVVLDRALRPVRPGVTGELYLFGSSLARGYLGDPALTAARFVAAPDGRRMYRTGDLVRWVDVEGRWELAYRGRVDRQVKIRGQRVEPAEVDAVLRRSGARHAATVIGDGPGGPVLLAYVVVPDAVSVDDLLDACRRTLPRHMVPARIIEVESIARTSSGKIDESALPRPDWSASGRAPVTPIEYGVVDAFRAVLHTHVGMDDDYFAAGGNSLSLVWLRDEIADRTGWRPAIADLYAHTTPAEVAALIDTPRALDDRRTVELSAPAADRPILWVVHLVSGVVTPYRALAAALPGYRVVGLQLPELIDGGTLPSSLSEIAALHVAAMRSVQPTGPYRVAGWSVGGVIAHEIARQIVEAGGSVADLILLDPRTPDTMSDAPAEEAAGVAPQIVAAVRSHRGGTVPVGKVLYIAASDTPGPIGWDRFIDGAVDVIALPDAHRDFGDPDVMRRIAHILEEEM
ncbi:amino acid adenylation domain-containing protein [Gordonia sp. NPDC003504]